MRQTDHGMAKATSRESKSRTPRGICSLHNRSKKEVQKPDRSLANSTGHLDVLTIVARFSLDSLPARASLPHIRPAEMTC